MKTTDKEMMNQLLRNDSMNVSIIDDIQSQMELNHEQMKSLHSQFKLTLYNELSNIRDRNKSNKRIYKRNWCPNSDNICGMIYCLLAEHDSSILSWYISCMIYILIIISSTTFIIQTLPQFHDTYDKNGIYMPDPIFVYIEIGSIGIFTVEYVLKLLTAHSGMKNIDGNRVYKTIVFILNPYNLIDLTAILPFYISYIMDPTTKSEGFSVFRLLRLLQIFKLFNMEKYNNSLEIFYKTLKSSMNSILLLIFISFIVVILIGSITYMVERGTYTINGCIVDDTSNDRRDCYLRKNKYGTGNEESPFTSIPKACWWGVTTISTVGYGDLYPTSVIGQIMAVICMYVGALGFALPIGILATNFGNVKKHHYESNAIINTLNKMDIHMNKNMEELWKQFINEQNKIKGLLIKQKDLIKNLQNNNNNRNDDVITNSVELNGMNTNYNNIDSYGSVGLNPRKKT